MARYRLLTGLALAVALLGFSAVAWASIPGSDGVIHGCYKTSNPAQGAVIAIDSGATCPSGYAALNWNQTGPPGVSGYEVISASVDITGPGLSWNTAAICSTGKTVLSGGFVVNPGDLTNYYIVGNRPGPNHDNWNAAISYYGTATGRLDVYAICAYVN